MVDHVRTIMSKFYPITEILAERDVFFRRPLFFAFTRKVDFYCVVAFWPEWVKGSRGLESWKCGCWRGVLRLILMFVLLSIGFYFLWHFIMLYLSN